MQVLVRRLTVILGILLLLIVGAVYIVGFWPLRNPHPAEYMAKGTLAIQNAKIYTSPDTHPIERGTIVIQDGRIAAVGAAIPVPSVTQIIPCDHCVVTAGFWNAHVQSMAPAARRGWRGKRSPSQPVMCAAKLTLVKRLI